MNSAFSNGNPQAARARPGYQYLILFLMALFVLFAYTFLHEGGHALTGLLFGGQMRSFNVNFFDLSAHVGMNGNFSPVQRSFISMSGILLPLLVWTGLVLITTSNKNPVLAWLTLMGSMVTLNTLIAWIVIPWLFLFGNAPSDDSTTFLRITGISPMLVSVTASLVYISGWFFYLKRMGNLKDTLRRLRNAIFDLTAPASRPSLMSLVLVTFILIATLAGINAVYPTSSYTSQAPENYSQVKLVDLNQKSYTNEAIFSFSLEEAEEVSFYIEIIDIQHGPAQVGLYQADNLLSTWISGDERFSTQQATLSPKERLPVGDYEIRISFPQSPKGQIRVFLPEDFLANP